MGATKGARGLTQFSRKEDKPPSAPDQADFPPDFDPDINPILARHWFGVHPHGVSALWSCFAGHGLRLPAERGVNVIEGGR